MLVNNDHQSILQWGERNGLLHHIDEVENGMSCNCICSYCGNPLVAKNNGLIKVHHFAHLSGVECAKAVESAVHKLAKQVLSNAKTLMLPACDGFGPKGMHEYIQPARIDFDHVIVEKNTVIEDERIRPDAIGLFGGNTGVFIVR